MRTPAERAALELANPPRSAAEVEARAIRRKHDHPADGIQEIVNRLGHRGYRIETTISGNRWFAWCSCGWVSTTRPFETDAAGALVHHIRLAMRAWHRTGLPLDAVAPLPEPDWSEIARRNPHWARRVNAEYLAAWRTEFVREVV